MNVRLKEEEGSRKLYVAENFILERCPSLKSEYLRKARCVSESSWSSIKEQGVRWYEFSTIPNRAPHFVVERLGKEDDLIRIARFGNPEDVNSNAKKKLLAAFEEMSDYNDMAFYRDYRDESGARIKTEVSEMYFESFTWLKVIDRFFNNGWIFLGLPTKRDMMKIIVELLADKSIKGLKITNTDALQRKMNWYRDHKGDKRSFVIHKNLQNKNGQKVTDDMVELFKAIFSGLSGGKLNFEEVWFRYSQFVAGDRHFINTNTGEVYEPKNYIKISKSTIKNYLYKYENKIGVFANRSGDWNKFSAATIPHYEFEMPKYSNSLLSIDDFQPPFIYAGNNRAWFYGAVDLASGAWISWVYGKDKDLPFLKKFYLKMILNFHKWGIGMPREIEMESHLNSLLKTTLLLPGTLTEKATIYQNKPNSKKVERYIGMIRNEKARLHPNFQARPFSKAEYLSKGAHETKEMLYEEIVRLYVKYIEDHNNEPHEKDSSMTRMEYFLKNQNPDCQPIQWTKLLPYLGYHTQATVKGGIVRYRGGAYLIGNAEGIASGDELKNIAAQLNDDRVSIYYIQDEDSNHIASGIYTSDDRYICSLHPIPKPQKAHCEKTEEDVIKSESMARYQNTFITNVKHQKNKIQTIEEVYEHPYADISEEAPEILPDIDEEVEVESNNENTSTWNRF